MPSLTHTLSPSSGWVYQLPHRAWLHSSTREEGPQGLVGQQVDRRDEGNAGKRLVVAVMCRSQTRERVVYKDS